MTIPVPTREQLLAATLLVEERLVSATYRARVTYRFATEEQRRDFLKAESTIMGGK